MSKITEREYYGSALSMYNDKGYLIPDEDDDEDRAERRLKGAKELGNMVKNATNKPYNRNTNESIAILLTEAALLLND